MRTVKFVGLLFLVSVSTLVWAQTSALRGNVYDPKGAVVASATVTLSNPATGFSRTTKSDAQGLYQFVEVPPSSYKVTVAAPGFATLQQTNVLLQVNTPVTLNLTLQVSAQATTIEVTAEASIVNTQDASLGHTFNSLQLQALPAADRDPVSLLSLQPGVVFFNKEATNPDNDSRNGSVNGARSDQTNVTYDGLDNNDQLKGSAFQGVLRATLDSLQEFRVTTGNANADAGRSSGAQVALVTKSGTNNWHGSLYEYHRPTFTSANDWFNKRAQLQSGRHNVPPKVLRNTFGGSVGGPIRKDRTFFFVSYEGFRAAETQQIIREIPTQSLRSGFLKYLCNPSNDPNCTPGNAAGIQVQSDPRFAPDLVATLMPAQIATIDCNRPGGPSCPPGVAGGVNPLVAGPNGVLQQYPLPNSTAVGDLLNTEGITFPASTPTHFNTYIVKLDQKLTANGNHTLFIRGNLQNDRFVPGSRCPTPVSDTPCPQFPGRPASQTFTANSKGLSAGYTALFSNTLVNNFRYGYVREGENSAGLAEANINFIHFRGLDNIQPFRARSLFFTVPVHNFINDTTWTKGKHTIEFGTNWRLVRNNRASNEQNFSEGITNLFWMSPSFISGTGASLDPAVGAGYPAVDSTFGTSYDFAAMDVAGIVTESTSYINQNKNATLIPNGQMIPRHFKNFEGEFYVQDSWRATPNLTLTAGLRYSMLQPPYEANGEQVQPTVSTHDWFGKRAIGALQGTVDQPLLTFNLSGQANGRNPYWNWDYKNIAPRVAFAYSPSAESGLLHRLFGGAGKSSIRGGYGIYFDHFGMGVVNSFDRHGSYGLTTFLENAAGFLGVDTAPRFTGLTNVPNLVPGSVQPHGFPFTPSGDPTNTGLAITWGLDDRMKTPYSHVFDLSITRELPKNLVVEATYTGRLGRRLLQEWDLAEPLNLVDPQSGMDYFTAAQYFDRLAVQGVPINNVSSLPYWEHLFPLAAGPGKLSGSGGAPCSPGTAPANPSATQNMYDTFFCSLGNETLALELADAFCLPACAGTGGTPFQFYQPQFSSLYAWVSRGTSAYHGLQLSLRRRMSKGLQFDVNYSFSKSMDVGSNAERVNGYEATGGVAYNDQVINTWRPRQWWAPSDYDLKHQINANFVYELPLGHGRAFGSGMGRIANAVIGGWGLSGIFRWTSGFPFSVSYNKGWSTNFELQGTSIQVGPRPKTGTFIVNGDPVAFDPKQFPTPASLQAEWRFPFVGESGQRNNYRGPGYFEIDSGLNKTWKITESQNVQFRWETFNTTNSVRFDAANSISGGNEDITDITGFGKYQSTLTKPRIMQFSLRYEF